MKPIFAVAMLLCAPCLFAQSSPTHSGLHSSRSDIPDRTDHPTGSAEKQAAMEIADHGSSQPQSYSTPTAPAPTYEPSADHTTAGEVEDLAAKFKKIREAREAKAKKEKEAAAKQ